MSAKGGFCMAAGMAGVLQPRSAATQQAHEFVGVGASFCSCLPGWHGLSSGLGMDVLFCAGQINRAAKRRQGDRRGLAVT